MTYIGNKDTNLDSLFKILPLINPKFILQKTTFFWLVLFIIYTDAQPQKPGLG